MVEFGVRAHFFGAFHRYDGAGHGFQDFSNPDRFCKAQSDDAWEKAIAFFDQHLK